MIKSIKNVTMVFCFLMIAALFITACQIAPPQYKTSQVFDGILFKSDRVPSGIVTLTNGRYAEKGAGGSDIAVHLDDHIAMGKINRKDTAAAILVTDTGEGEIYYDLFLLIKKSSGWISTDAVALGDRIKVVSLSIVDNEIIAHFLGQGPYDRPCCSTLDTVYKYGVSEDRLIKKIDYSSGSGAKDLVGTVWKWRATSHKNNAYSESYDPNLYTLTLKKNGGINVRVDCNTTGGQYAVTGENISIHIAHPIMAVCPDDSFSNQYLSDLENAARYYCQGGNLYIVLKNEDGVMKFSS